MAILYAEARAIFRRPTCLHFAPMRIWNSFGGFVVGGGAGDCIAQRHDAGRLADYAKQIEQAGRTRWS